MKKYLPWLFDQKKCQSAVDQRDRRLYRLYIEYIILMRHFCNLSQCQAADLININRVTLNRYENQNQEMSISAFVKIRVAYEGYISDNRLKLTPQILELIHQFSVPIHQTSDGAFLQLPK